MNLRVGAVAKAVHAPEALSHAFKRGQITKEMVGRDVNADLAGTGADQIDRAVCYAHALGPIGLRQEASEDWVLWQVIALQAAHRACELLDLQLVFLELGHDLFHVVDRSNKDQNGFTRRLESLLQGKARDPVHKFLVLIVNGMKVYDFAGVDPTPDDVKRFRGRVGDVRPVQASIPHGYWRH